MHSMTDLVITHIQVRSANKYGLDQLTSRMTSSAYRRRRSVNLRVSLYVSYKALDETSGQDEMDARNRYTSRYQQLVKRR